jgi:hypothetical protein
VADGVGYYARAALIYVPRRTKAAKRAEELVEQSGDGTRQLKLRTVGPLA